MSFNPHVSADPATLRLASTAIATSYDSSPTALRMQNWNRLTLFCDLTLATATSVELRIEAASPTGDSTPAAGDWFAIGTSNVSGLTVSSGVATVPVGATIIQLALTDKYAIAINNCNYKWVRVKAKTTGGPGATTLAITATQGLV